MIKTFHDWYNTPLAETEWRWLLSGSRVAVLILVLILIFVMLRNGYRLGMMRRYMALVLPLSGLAFYYFDQLFWDTALNVQITPAVIIFNLMWGWLLLAASIVSRDAKRAMDDYAAQQRITDNIYGKRIRSVLARRGGRHLDNSQNQK